MDNYFVNREDTPRDENGQWDFEHLETLDLPLFRQHVQDLLDGKTISLPFYNFETGMREYRGETLRLEEDTVVILEGLHALNPALIPDIPRSATFKIYVSALTTVNLDSHNWIPTVDVRLIRRIVRDYRYRGYSARETIARLDSVERGANRWIAPFQEEADVMFNSSLLFELAALKRHAEPILDEVPKYCDEYTTAHRLKKYLSYFESIPENEIPPTSFLREFVGVVRSDIKNRIMNKIMCILTTLLWVIGLSAQEQTLPLDTLLVDSLHIDTLQSDTLQSDTLHTFILDAMPNAIVHQDSAITLLLEDKSYNRQRGQHQVNGFRVQVYASNTPQVAKNEALDLYETISSQVNMPVYVISEPPFWKVRLGDFLTREEAIEYKNQLNVIFPHLQGSTYVVPDQVTVNN
jgi:uridine kinase